jgi:hypothetical protein
MGALAARLMVIECTFAMLLRGVILSLPVST